MRNKPDEQYFCTPFLGLIVLGCQSACVTVTVDTVDIVASDFGGTPTTFQTEVSVLNHSDSCEYRLEYNTPDDLDWAINEVAGNQGPPQRISVPDCTPPTFDETDVTNLSWYEEQTIYYWVKEAREYATERLWSEPAGPPTFEFNVATDAVSPDLLTRSMFRDLGCFPDPTDGCMRAWQHEGAKLHFLAGSIVARAALADPSAVDLIAHEYGHYAAGYIFGHMDVFGVNGFDITNCAKRSFQEAIATIFERLFLHEIQTTAVPAAATPGFAGQDAQWRNQCGTADGVMGQALFQAFEQALWGTSAGGLTVTWSSTALANNGMAAAFAYALSENRGHRIHQLAYAILDYLELHPDPGNANHHAEIVAVFAEHGMAPTELGGNCQNNDECISEYCDRGDGTSKTELCMPGANAGQVGELCTHDNQCDSENCDGLMTDAFNNWVPGLCQVKKAIGASCSSNGQCGSNYCDAGWGTSKTDQCMPSAGAGVNGQVCSNDNQCNSSNCIGLTSDAMNNWIPGVCGAASGLGATCSENYHCTSDYCDSGDGTSRTNQCMPAAGTGAAGEVCSNHDQCSSFNCEGLFADNFGNWNPGLCGDKRGLGLNCSNNDHCVSGYCDTGNNTSHTDQCMPGPSAGANGEMCSNDNQCASFNCEGLVQDGGGNWIPGLCDSKRVLGFGCTENHQCQSDYCDAGDGTSRTNQCMPGPMAGSNGDICSNDNQCVSNNCAGLMQDPFGDWVPGQCNAKFALLVRCTANNQCTSDYCDTGNNTSHTDRCMPGPSSGAGGDACSNNNQCASNDCAGLTPNPDGTWNPGICDARLPLGQACTQNPDCVSGYCDTGNNTSHTDQCMPGPGGGTSGDTCSNNNQCSSGICLGLTPNSDGSWNPGNCT